MRMSSRVIVLLLVAAGLGGLPATAEEPPGNDAFEQARDVSVPSLVHGTLAGATIEPGEPGCHRFSASVWYRLNVVVPTPVIVSLRDVVGNMPAAAVFIGTQVEDLQMVTCSDPGFVDFYASPSETYYIQITQSQGAQTADFTLSFGIGTWEFRSGPFFLFAAGAGFNVEADGATAVAGGYVLAAAAGAVASSYLQEGSEVNLCAWVIIVLPETCVTA